MIVKTDTGERDVPITEVTPQNYIVPERERGEYHCIVEVKKFDGETGKRLSIPRIQKFGQKVFETVVLPNLKKQGYTIEILYNPTEYLKQRAKARAASPVQDAVQKALAKQAAEFQAKQNELLSKQDELIAAAVEKALAARRKKK